MFQLNFISKNKQQNNHSSFSLKVLNENNFLFTSKTGDMYIFNISKLLFLKPETKIIINPLSA
jgi:hypothetical protein